MPLVTMRDILDEAAGGDYAVGAFAVSNLEAVQAVVQAAGQTGSPLVLQASRGSLQYGDTAYLPQLLRAAAESSNTPVALHFDGARSVDSCKRAIDLGFNSVCIDGSRVEDWRDSTWEENIAITTQVVELARPFGVTVEGRPVLCPGSIEEAAIGVTDGQLLPGDDAKEIAEFVAQTGVDVVRIEILGHSHSAIKVGPGSAYKFGSVGNWVPWLARLREYVPEVHLSLAGACDLWHVLDLLDIINAHGGSITQWGGYLTREDLREFIGAGFRKITVDSVLRLALTAGARRALSAERQSQDPRQWLGQAREEASRLCADIMRVLGHRGHGRGDTSY